jgi:hypothetical protein
MALSVYDKKGWFDLADYKGTSLLHYYSQIKYENSLSLLSDNKEMHENNKLTKLYFEQQ